MPETVKRMNLGIALIKVMARLDRAVKRHYVSRERWKELTDGGMHGQGE